MIEARRRRLQTQIVEIVHSTDLTGRDCAFQVSVSPGTTARPFKIIRPPGGRLGCQAETYRRPDHARSPEPREARRLQQPGSTLDSGKGPRPGRPEPKTAPLSRGAGPVTAPDREGSSEVTFAPTRRRDRAPEANWIEEYLESARYGFLATGATPPPAAASRPSPRPPRSSPD